MNQQGNQPHDAALQAAPSLVSPTSFWQAKGFKFIVRLTFVLVACAAFGAWSTYDYGLRCAKCLTSKHVVEQRFFGVPFFRSTTAGATEMDYARIFGHSCQHMFRKGGFGRGARFLFMPTVIGCGSTAEGGFVRARVDAVSATFALERRLSDRALTLETFRIIDQLWPPTLSLEQRQEHSKEARVTVLNLGYYLPRVNTVEQWRAVLTAARDEFKDLSNLPTE